MGHQPKRSLFAGEGWLSSRLTRKVILTLVAVGVLSYILLCCCFLAFLSKYARDTYDLVVAEADAAAQDVALFLEGSAGDVSGLQAYLQERQISCAIQEPDGTTLFESLPFDRQDLRLAASGSAKSRLSNGVTLEVLVWVPAMAREEISSALSRNAFLGLSILNFCIFCIAAVVICLLVVAPTVRLRRTMRQYYESGARPERTGRQDELGRLQNTFVDLVEVVARKEQAERHLIASISHDIKTPLTSVMGYSERLRSADLAPEKQRQYLDSVYEKALAIKSVVDEFDEYLDVGLRDTAPMRLLTVEELCSRLQKEYQAELCDAKVGFQVHCDCPQAQLLCNWEHMRRFFGNLIGNSIQHAGGDCLQLTLDCREEAGQIVFLFRDNGPGVAPELLEQIFEPLYTSDRGRKVSGLGLSICKSIIKAHGGAIAAENLNGGGLQIRATLPRVDF